MNSRILSFRLIWPVTLIIAFLLGAVVCAHFFPQISTCFSSDREIEGTSLSLFAKRGPFAIYTDSTQANAKDVFAIFNGDYCLFKHGYSEDGSVEITHFEKGRNLLCSTIDKKGRVSRSYTALNDDGNTLCVYIDNESDGVWDMLLDFHKKKKFMWQDNKWTDNTERARSGVIH